MWGFMGFPVGVCCFWGGDRSYMSLCCFMFVLCKGTGRSWRAEFSFRLCIHSHPLFFFSVWMDVCYTRYMLDAWNIFHICWQQIHVNIFSFATYSYAEKLAQMPSSSGFCSVVLTDALLVLMEIHQCLKEAQSVCYTLFSLLKTDVLSASFWRFS